MAGLKLKLLGGFELQGGDNPRLPTRKAEALLAFLAMPAGKVHHRDKLAHCEVYPDGQGNEREQPWGEVSHVIKLRVWPRTSLAGYESQQ